MARLCERLLRTNVVTKCEGESGMFDSLKTELLKYVWLMHQGRDIQIIQRMEGRQLIFLEIVLSVFSSKSLSIAYAYKTAFMTSAKQLLHGIKFRHGDYIHR